MEKNYEQRMKDHPDFDSRSEANINSTKKKYIRELKLICIPFWKTLFCIMNSQKECKYLPTLSTIFPV